MLILCLIDCGKGPEIAGCTQVRAQPEKPIARNAVEAGRRHLAVKMSVGHKRFAA